MGLANKDYLKIASLIYRSELLHNAFCLATKPFSADGLELACLADPELYREYRIFSSSRGIENTLKGTAKMFLEIGELNRLNPGWDFINPLQSLAIRVFVNGNTKHSISSSQEIISKCANKSEEKYKNLENILNKIIPFMVSLDKVFE